MNALDHISAAVATARGFGQAAMHRLRLLWAKLAKQPK